jgi:hypothetical protein
VWVVVDPVMVLHPAWFNRPGCQITWLSTSFRTRTFWHMEDLLGATTNKAQMWWRWLSEANNAE